MRKEYELIRIKFSEAAKSDRSNLGKLCMLYWTRSSGGGFAYKIAEIGQKLNITALEVSRLAREHSEAHVKVDAEVCRFCGQDILHALKSRSSEAHPRNLYPHSSTFVAHIECDKELARRDAALQDSREEELVAEMVAAFDKGAYEALKPLEFNFLVRLALEPNFSSACKSTGISIETGNKLLHVLRDARLLGMRPNGHYFFLAELTEILKSESKRRQVKSVFGSPRALELYRELKREHGFVFPEIPLCAFIERPAVDHLFTESWHSGYFLTCRLDFVVCDPDGKPVFCVEYQGGYHADQQQQKKDGFKRLILEAVGVPLKAVNYKTARAAA